MDMATYKLQDNRYLVIRLFEIASFPAFGIVNSDFTKACEKVSESFVRLLNEVYNLSGDSVCLEILWATEKAVNQLFKSRIRVFCVIRVIGQSEQQATYELDNIYSNLRSALSFLQYNLQETAPDDKDLFTFLDAADNKSLLAVVKGEKCVSNSNSIYPYYYSEVIPFKNNTNFQSFISALSETENCCVSFQLFPAKLTNDERYLFNEVSAELTSILRGRNINGMMYRDPLAEIPSKVYEYYNEKAAGSFYTYNILTFGDRASCVSMATKIISLLQAGSDKIMETNYSCMDLSKEAVSLRKQFTFYPWNIQTRLMYYYRNQRLQAVVPLAKRMSRLPYLLTVEEAVSFFRLPLHERSMTALTSNQVIKAQEQFSSKVVNPDNIQFGTLVTNNQNEITIGCPQKTFTKHGLIVGVPGSGKTTFAVYILLQFARKGIPFLAIEPTKSEYRAMIEAIPDLQIFTPGNNAVSPFICNPFIPPRGIRIEQYIPSLASAFKAAFSMPSPLDMVFLRAIRASYTEYGWKDYSMLGDPDVRLFGLNEFIRIFKGLIRTMDYSKEVKGNLESAGILRLTNLLEQNSNIYDSINTVPIEDLLSHPTVLELNSIDNEEQKALIMALLLINICVYTKHNQIGDGELKNVILIDEAHVLLGGGSSSGENGAESQATTVKALQDMIAEIRSYGTSIIIADQSPAKVSREVVGQTDIKVAFRLVQSLEKELIADSTNMDDESRDNLSRLEPGQAYAYFSQLDSPQLIYTPDIREKEGIRLSVPDSEVAQRSTYWNNHKELLIPFSECRFCGRCRETCDFTVRSNAEYIASKAISKYQSKIKSNDDLKLVIFNIPKVLKEEIDKCTGLDWEKLAICSRIKFYRKMLLNSQYSLDDKDLATVIRSFPKSVSSGDQSSVG